MLLNEFLKEHRTVNELRATVAQQQKQLEALTAGAAKGDCATRVEQGSTSNGAEMIIELASVIRGLRRTVAKSSAWAIRGAVGRQRFGVGARSFARGR